MTQDIRWQQRFANYKKALEQLDSAITLQQQRKLSDLEKQGLIQAFEFTHELAWNCLKDFLEYRGQSGIYGSRDATRKAFELEIITDGESWMDMIITRNRSSHTYNQQVMEEIIDAISNKYFLLFISLSDQLEKLKNDPDF